MCSNYPPGVSGLEPQITGEYPIDPHEPFWASWDTEQVVMGSNPRDFMGSGYGVYWGNEESPRSTHPTYEEAQAVMAILNAAIPDGCHFRIADRGRSGCLTCGDPDWDALFPADDPVDRLETA